MCTIGNKLLLLTLLLSVLPFVGFAQGADKLVNDYVDLLNGWLKEPIAPQANKFCSIFTGNGNGSGIKDEFVQLYNGQPIPVHPKSYLSIFDDKGHRVNNRIDINVELMGTPVVKSEDRGLFVYATIKFVGGKLDKPLITCSKFWIKKNKIYTITMDDEGTIELRNNENATTTPQQSVTAQDSQPTQPKNDQPNKPKEEKPKNNNSQPQPTTTLFNFRSSPDYASVYVDGNYVGMTSTSKALVPGTHTIRVTRWRCKTFEKQMELRSDDTDINIKLKQLLNRRFEFYLEGNYLMNGMTAYGATLGGFLDNINIEATYYLCLDKSEDIYWCDNESLPVKCNYTPDLIASAKLGYGIPIGTRFRITPQVGANYLTLKEDLENDKIAKGANSLNIIGSIRFSIALTKHLKISITPEYQKNISTSAGYEILKDTSPIIQKWTEGINVKFGLAFFF